MKPHGNQHQSGRKRSPRSGLVQLGAAFNAAGQKGDITTPWSLRFHFWRLMKKHRSWLEQDVEGWGKVGYVLTCIGRPRAVIEWLGDWKKRPQAESWMLYNLIIMLQRLGKYDESRDLIRHAVALRHGDDYYEEFRVWAAFEEALAGNIAEAEQHLAHLPRESRHDHLLPLRSMAEMLISMRQRPAADRRKARGEIRSGLKQAFSAAPPHQARKYVRDGYHRFVTAVSGHIGGLGPWSWWFYRGKGWWRLAGMTLLVPVALLFPPLLLGLVIYWVVNRSRRG